MDRIIIADLVFKDGRVVIPEQPGVPATVDHVEIDTDFRLVLLYYRDRDAAQA